MLLSLTPPDQKLIKFEKNGHFNTWVFVTHGSQLPAQAVRLMGRPLNRDPSAREAYVGWWYANGGRESTFGHVKRCDNGQMVAWFPWGDREWYSDSTGEFRVLVNQTNETYLWVHPGEVRSNPGYDLCVADGYCPAIVMISGEEWAGKASLDRRMAWTGAGGKEYFHTGYAFDNCYVLVRKDY
ncbi:unnamed protein product, partial [Mesorhabditis belari]|uniref:Uncharacterized protein n=1 Tax=Mesorhabditis belari TaxID=2138241 RepID=A0AAF3EHM1_9BILA